MRALELYINQALSHPLVYGENTPCVPCEWVVSEPPPRVRGKHLKDELQWSPTMSHPLVYGENNP